MKWKEITIYTTEEGTEIILARLDMLGITQVNIVQGDEEIDALLHSCEKYWDYADEAAMGKQPSVQAYVSDVPENAAVEQAVRNSIAELDSMQPKKPRARMIATAKKPAMILPKVPLKAVRM